LSLELPGRIEVARNFRKNDEEIVRARIKQDQTEIALDPKENDLTDLKKGIDEER